MLGASFRIGGGNGKTSVDLEGGHEKARKTERGVWPAGAEKEHHRKALAGEKIRKKFREKSKHRSGREAASILTIE